MRVRHKMLDRYAAMAEVTARMLAAARREDWDTVAAEEHCCRAIADELEAIGDVDLSEAEADAKHRLVLRMLADDAAIRELAEPWMKKLEDLLSSSGNSRKLDACYGA